MNELERLILTHQERMHSKILDILTFIKHINKYPKKSVIDKSNQLSCLMRSIISSEIEQKDETIQESIKKFKIK